MNFSAFNFFPFIMSNQVITNAIMSSLTPFNLLWMLANIILLFVFSMQEKGDFSCSCIGNIFTPQEKFFLVRKKELEEHDPSVPRRSNKSSEFKNQSEGKPQKKSLKKRPLSNFSAESSAPFTPADLPKFEEMRATFNPHDPQFTFSRAQQHAFSAATFMPHPSSTRYVDGSYKQKSNNQFGDQTYNRPQPAPQFFPAPSRTLTLQPTSRHSPSPQNGQLHQSSSLPQSEENSYQPQWNGPRPSRQARESSGPKDQSLIIEDFERLFVRQDIIPGDKPQRIREVHRSRRFSKQQLIGRFAESDDDAASDVPSEVIGKGFQNSFNDFWEDGSNAKQTFASRTTNTKLSELQRVSDNLQIHNTQETHTHQRNRFGTIINYKSYKFL